MRWMGLSYGNLSKQWALAPSNTRLLLARPRRLGRRAIILIEDCGGLTWPRSRSAASLGRSPFFEYEADANTSNDR